VTGGKSGVAGLGRVGIIGGETASKWERVKREDVRRTTVE
jgi:hypothetical protein